MLTEIKCNFNNLKEYIHAAYSPLLLTLDVWTTRGAQQQSFRCLLFSSAISVSVLSSNGTYWMVVAEVFC